MSATSAAKGSSTHHGETRPQKVSQVQEEFTTSVHCHTHTIHQLIFMCLHFWGQQHKANKGTGICTLVCTAVAHCIRNKTLQPPCFSQLFSPGPGARILLISPPCHPEVTPLWGLNYLKLSTNSCCSLTTPQPPRGTSVHISKEM